MPDGRMILRGTKVHLQETYAVSTPDIQVPVPPAEHVRELLARNLQEGKLLRDLLRVSERTEEVRRLISRPAAQVEAVRV